MKLVNGSVRRPVGVIMFVIAALVLGAVSLNRLAIDLYPKLDLPVAIVTTTYSGASPQEIENLISKPIESGVSSVQNIDTVSSTSSPESSLVVLQFDWGTNVESVMNDVRASLDQVRPILPDDAGDPRVMRFDPQQIPVMWIGLNGAAPEELQQFSEDRLEPYFERVEGVASVSPEGGKEREIQVQLNPSQLDQYGLTSDQVVQALASENQANSAGTLKKGMQDLQLRVDGEFASVEEIRNTLIHLGNGDTVTVGNVATVQDTFKEMTSKSYVNGEQALVLSVMKESDGNTVDVADGMYQSMEEMKEDLPDGVSMSVILDTSTFIRQSISSVVNNMLLGAALSILILYLFLHSIRSTIVIGFSIPLAIISTFTLMYFTGETLNVLSMGGLALGIGMMVDSAIVILENIFKYKERGYSTIEAAKQGGSELSSAVVASTLTTIVVFVPIVFVEGMAAELFRPLAMTVSFALFASLVTALTLIPMLSSKLLTRTSGSGRLRRSQIVSRGFEKGFGGLQSRYEGFLNWALNHRKTIFFGSVGLVIASFLLVPLIGAAFIPPSDQGQVEVNVETPSGTDLEETQQTVKRVEQEIVAFDDVIKTNYMSIGGGGVTPGSGGSNVGSFTIQLVEPSEREITTQQFMDEVKNRTQDIAGAEITVSEQAGGMGTGSPIQVNISGSDWDVLRQLGEQVVWLIEDVEGAVNAESSLDQGRPEMQIQVDREIAAQYGLTYQQVMGAVRTAFNGQIATRYRTGDDEVDVRVVLPEDERETINDLQSMSIQTSTGNSIPLTTVATLEQVQGPAQITRENQQRQINVTGEIQGRNLGSVTGDIRAQLDSLALPDGYSIDMGGQSQDMAESFRNLGMALALSIFLVYMVMAVQFESFVFPFVVMFSLPTTFVGILVGLFITGKPLSVPAFIGVIMLAGIVVNNAIVLVDYINILRRQGNDRKEAILEAGSSRLRPILMTTLTTSLAMVPIALGIGQGTEAQSPMAVVIIFGLIFSTMVTLVLVPVMYTYLDGLSNWIKRLFRRSKSSSQGDANVTG